VKLSPFLRGSVALHAAAVPALAIAPERWPWIAGTLFADHCAVLAGGLMPRSAWLGENVVRSAAAEQTRAIALTFDDGPDPRVTPLILDRLDARGARASFFCIGERALAHRDLAAEIARRGHRLENHSHTHHPGFFFHPPGALDREIEACQEALAGASGRAPVFFRAPAGIRSPLLDAALARAGLRLASWTRRGFDTVARDPRSIASRLTRDLRAGDVLVLHDGSSRSRPDRGRIVLDALDRLLDAAGSAGLGVAPLHA